MLRNIIIGLIVLAVIFGLMDACVSCCSNAYNSFFSTHEEVLEAIDEGHLSKAKELLPDAKESELYRCAQLLIEEYIAIDDVKMLFMFLNGLLQIIVPHTICNIVVYIERQIIQRLSQLCYMKP